MKMFRVARPKRFGRFYALLLLSVGFPLMLVAAEVQPRMAIFYPEMSKASHQKIFADIMDGVESSFNGDVKRYSLNKGYDLVTLGTQLAKDDVDVVVGLGRLSFSVIKKLPLHQPVLLGAMTTIKEEGYGGIEWYPAASVMLEKLQLLAPQVDELHVVYSPAKSKTLIKVAKELAQSRGIKLNAYPSSDVREAAAAYQNILAMKEGNNRAIWLMPGRSTLNNAILDDVLRKAWKKKFTVFSTALRHVQQGALFSVFPDDIGMGRSLGNLAQGAIEFDGKCEIRPLRDVRLAVNRRTSDHLGLIFDKALREQIDLLLPTN